MSLKNYSDAFAGCSTTVLGVNQVAELVAALTPPASSPTVPASSPVVATKPALMDQVKGFAPGLVGAGAGAYMWKKHRVLGALAGHAMASSALDFYRGDKKKAVCDLVVEGAGIGGALYLKKSPILGWVGGVLAGAAATYFVDGSPVRNQVRKRLGK